MVPYQSKLDAIIVEYATNPDTGLSTIEAQKRFAEHGANLLPADKRRSWPQIFISQFQSPLIYILLMAAVIIFFVGNEPRDAFIIAGVLLFNAIIGAMQEGRTADIVQSLKQFIETTSVVIRNNKRKIVDDRMLVVGDLVILQEGEKVPADIRIIESHNLTIDQSILTGESSPVAKNADQIVADVPLMERANMVYKGTYILSGFGKGIVTATGLHTEIGLIHHVIEEINTEVPLRKDVEHLTYVILLSVLGLCTGLFALGYVMGKPLNELMVMLTALFICIVPEGLPVVLTLVLVSGVYRMAKQFVLVKNMQAVETLGRTDVIVIDKTGTLTRNEMMVSHVYTNDKILYYVSGQGYHVDGDITRDNHAIRLDEASNDLMLLGQAGYLLNTAEINYHAQLDLFSIKGDPTEAALYVFAQKLGIDGTTVNQYVKVYEILFDSRNAYHASFYVKGAEAYVYMLGAPEVIFAKTYDSSTEIKDALHRFLEKGLRMVACAVRILKASELPRPDSPTTAWHVLLTQMHCVGIVGIQDAIRPDVKYVIAQARNAGLNLIMATGDHQKTALYVAQEVGIYTHGDKMLDGPRMDQLTDEQLINESIDVTIYSRVSSFHKMRIIKALHARHMIVAMTGDGINDAPSLVAADLGIAMGRIGTEVAKRASDIILLNDSCISIIRAIEQGRHIFYTLKRVILYFFATNTGEIFIIFFALIVEIITGKSLPLPLTAAQILWLNLVTDGFLNIALSMEPQERGLLSRNWLVHKPQLVDAPLIGKMLLFAFPMGVVSLYMFLRYYQIDVRYARTMTFVTMTMFQWFNAWNCRSDTKSLVQLGLGTNRWLLAATVLILILQMCILNIPWLQGIFNTVPLSGHDWLLIIAVSLPIIFLEEIRKWIVRTLYAL